LTTRSEYVAFDWTRQPWRFRMALTAYLVELQDVHVAQVAAPFIE
jgi:hypothetical protein